jgi:pimeloyl-ACP methyl ester carboxylesterase
LAVRGPIDLAEPEMHTWMSSLEAWSRQLGGYASLQASKPQSLAYCATGNPVGQAAWILERFHDWSDLRGGCLQQVYGWDALITSVMLYLMSDSFTTSAWFYAGGEIERADEMPSGLRVETPTGFAAYRNGSSPVAPRALLERYYNIVHWKEQARGGHFPAMEVPDLFVADLRAWGAIVNL